MKLEQIGIIAILLVIVSCVGLPLIANASYTTGTEIIEKEETQNNTGGTRWQIIMGSSDTYVFSGDISPGWLSGNITKNGTSFASGVSNLKAYGIEMDDYSVNINSDDRSTYYSWGPSEMGHYGTFTISYTNTTLSITISGDWEVGSQPRFPYSTTISNVPFIMWKSNDGNYTNIPYSKSAWFKPSEVIGISSTTYGCFVNNHYQTAIRGESSKTNVKLTDTTVNEYGYNVASGKDGLKITYDGTSSLFNYSDIYVPYQVTYTTTEEVEVEVKSAYADVLGAIPIVCIAAIVISIGMWTYNFKKN